MPQTSFPRPLLTALLALVCACGAPAALAERADREKPMNAEADALRYDDARQTSVFSGRVVITKGTIQIRGAQVEVRQDPQGHQFGLVLAGPGQPASYRQKRDNVDEHIEGEAQRIEYDGRADQVKFIGQAVLRRYRGTTLSDETAGAVIVYDNQTEVFRVDGGPASASASNPSGRVRATLAPRSQVQEQPAKPVPLQPSTGLRSKP
ncbi:lipopolysaccharide transport periplasmic protein LptA [Malikia sp.]|uniref:lipopolysaccharide transport periplasmic protein LptA n=1 Tax=Malikia sp. TaxID=2070706 RepID=UPI002614D462|nr:lipopolysaccharide transport periplasmic protein LptA [Malikia sp.]MDD2729852.1 lipopolysaccharide transport periplasmic protein LptA [Malikia sp.]